MDEHLGDPIEYARLHHTVRLRWGFLDEAIAAPWVDPDEPSLHALVREAAAPPESSRHVILCYTYFCVNV